MDPFGVLGSTAAKIGADILTAAMLSLWNAGLWILKVVLELEDQVLTPNLAEDGPLGRLYQTTFWLALALVGIFMVVQIIIALARRDGRTVGQLVVGVVQFGFVWFAWIGYGVTIVAACGGLTRALMDTLLHTTTWAGWTAWKPFTVTDITDTATAVILGLLGLLMWLAAIGHALVLLARTAALFVLAATSPIAASGLVVEFGRSWFWRSLRWFHAAALTPPLMVLCLGIGVQIASGVALGGESDALASIGSAFVGIVLICTSTFAPMALFKLFAFVDPGSTSGASLRAGLTAAGGISGLLSGGGTGTSAASSADASGRTAGEDGASATATGRFASAASALGPLGQAVAGGVRAMTALGAMGATAGYDLTNSMGVGHNVYPPDSSRHAVKAQLGSDPNQRGTSPDAPQSSDGNTWATNPENTAPDPGLGEASGGLTRAFQQPPGSSSGAPGSVTRPPGGGAAAGDSALAGEAAEVAVIVL